MRRIALIADADGRSSEFDPGAAELSTMLQVELANEAGDVWGCRVSSMLWALLESAERTGARAVFHPLAAREATFSMTESSRPDVPDVPDVDPCRSPL